MGSGQSLLCDGGHIRNWTGKGRILHLALSQLKYLFFFLYLFLLFVWAPLCCKSKAELHQAQQTHSQTSNLCQHPLYDTSVQGQG